MCFWNTVLDPGDSVILRQSQYSYERSLAVAHKK